ncbi:MAG: carboxypeptidase-like regulatory domain-containing protein, partial [Planctomycetota bacterium]
GPLLEVGELRLDPCGVLTLKVINALDEPIETFTLACGGEKVYDFYRERISPGEYCYFQLPLGRLDLTIEADGFKTEERTLTLKPGQPLELKVVLSRS